MKETPSHVQELYNNIQILDHRERLSEHHNSVNDLVACLELYGRNAITTRYNARSQIGDSYIETEGETQVLFLKHPVPCVRTIGARVVVVNLDCGSPALSPICGSFGEGHFEDRDEPLLSMEPDQPESLVIIFKHNRPHPPLDSDRALDFPGEVEDYALWLSRYLDSWFEPAKDLSTILVGLNDFFRPKEDLERFITEFFMHLPPDNRVEFLSRKEYQRRVGFETYRLHTKL